MNERNKGQCEIASVTCCDFGEKERERERERSLMLVFIVDLLSCSVCMKMMEVFFFFMTGGRRPDVFLARKDHSGAKAKHRKSRLCDKL